MGIPPSTFYRTGFPLLYLLTCYRTGTPSLGAPLCPSDCELGPTSNGCPYPRASQKAPGLPVREWPSGIFPGIQTPQLRFFCPKNSNKKSFKTWKWGCFIIVSVVHQCFRVSDFIFQIYDYQNKKLDKVYRTILRMAIVNKFELAC